MTPDGAMAAVATGARAEARHHHRPTPVAVGRVVAYSVVPMVLLVDGDGVHHWHRHDMVELAPPLEQAAPGRWEGDDS